MSIAEDDIVVLFDQGGGSTEISWMRWGDFQTPRPTPDLRLYDELGTVALRSLFFERNKAGVFTPAEKNQTEIDTQLARVKDHVQRVASAWRGGPKKRSDNVVHVFGIGSALSKLTDNHLWRLERSFLDEQVDKSKKELDAIAGDIKQVRRLYSLQQELERDRSPEGKKTLKRLNSSLVKLYGLPAILGLLDRCRVDHIHFSNYGLAYGYYIDKYREPSLPAPEIYEGNEPYVFVSYCHADKLIAYRVVSELKALGFRVWYDPAMVGGVDWKDMVANKIAGCSAFLTLMSPDANLSENVLDEIRFAANNRQRPLINFVVRPTTIRNEIKFRLQDSIYLSWSAVDREYLKQLERALPAVCKQ